MSNECAPSAICRPGGRGILTNNQRPSCICPANTFGGSCHIIVNSCAPNPCLNSGVCYTSYEHNSIEDYICICKNHFSGNQCQKMRTPISVQLNNELVDTGAVASTIQFYDYDLFKLNVILIHQYVYSSTPQHLILYHDLPRAPFLCIMKTYGKDAQLDIPHYFVLYIQHNMTDINITSGLMEENSCPDVRQLWHLIESSMLSQYSDELSTLTVYNT
ncbi:unnamed protein product [Didymodactylos carnosus]|uniref:EGF-like domain-containing protein n=1 Tax=Didymodactylos carnosus TaxID=1234261 RepID=A0A814IA65_9BILA|nr:unnamed protein product [Didymodactylos carnosus]CAF1021666.1 unnamed protein product [Didymodactylos carnosus]CAF3586616.1 unnamed protein product [Didymodactylos carnosus]CAF3793086.1 unnamed protein product [Didymodactylos carnosus]